MLSALLTGVVFRGTGADARACRTAKRPVFRAAGLIPAFVGAVRSSVSGMLSVCGFVLFFYVLAQPLAALGGRLGPCLVGITELFSLTPLLTPDAFGFVLAAGAAGWGAGAPCPGRPAMGPRGGPGPRARTPFFVHGWVSGCALPAV